MTTLNTPRTLDAENILDDFFLIGERFKLSENLLQKMMKELNYVKKPTYPDGCGDPLKDIELMGNRPPNTYPSQPMEAPTPTSTPATEVAVTKVEVKPATITQEVIDKYAKVGKSLGLSEETISMITKELEEMMNGTEKKEEATEPSPAEPAPKKGLLAELLK